MRARAVRLTRRNRKQVNCSKQYPVAFPDNANLDTEHPGFRRGRIPCTPSHSAGQTIVSSSSHFHFSVTATLSPVSPFPQCQ
ncbi:hypothetical protein SDJN02_19623, partial [Cucurbita argyrosperma subsp. argyrosperma]